MAFTSARIARRDIAIAAVLSLLGLLLTYANVDRLTNGEPPLQGEQPAVEFGGLLPVELAFPLFLLVTVPLLWRRVAPIAAVGVACAGLLVNQLLIGTDLLRCGIVLPTACLFAFTAAQLDRRRAGIGLAFAFVMVVVDFGLSLDAVTAAVAGALTAAVWGVGRIVRSRGRMAADLRDRTAELREARDERARLEVATDRARLSRELDELLQRRLGELARMADGGVRPGDAAAATAALADIERESRRTLEEMRAVVGVLRDHSSQPSTAPHPTLTHLEALFLRANGSDARLIVDGSPRVLPAAVELAAYRIVEQLLGALDDAPDVEVRVRFGDDALELVVSGPADRRSKPAIERARQRAQLQGGMLEAKVRGGRAEAVASLPVLGVARA